MNPRLRSSENGQAAVLLVLAMVVLLGFAALAVDGSMVYSDRRFAQSGADAASLAGAGAAASVVDTQPLYKSTWSTNATCTSGNVAAAANVARNEAVVQAEANDLIIGDTTPAEQGFVTTECGDESITSPGVDGDGDACDTPSTTIYSAPYMDVKTVITRTTQTSFAQFVFKGGLVNSVTAVTRIRPRQPFAYGYAVVALNPDLSCNTCGNGTCIHGLGGSNDLTVTGGGMFSNGCFQLDGNPSASVEDAGVYFYGTDNHKTGFVIPSDPPPCKLTNTDTRIPPSSYEVNFDEASRCAGHWVDGDDIVNHGPLAGGLYCINGDLTLNNHTDTLIGDGVTIYIPDGYLTINGNATVKLKAPAQTYSGPAIAGVVIYVPKTNTKTNKDVQITGNSDSYFEGTILAPAHTVDFNGNGSIEAMSAQIIGWNVKIGGSTNTSVTYDDAKTADIPANLDFYR